MAAWTSRPSAGCSPTPGQALLARAARGVRRARRRPGAGRRPPCARHAEPAHAAAALTQVDLRARAAAKFGDGRRADVLHARRARAGHPRRGSRTHRAARIALARPPLGAGRRLRHRRRPGRAGAGRPDGGRRWTTTSCGSRWRAPTSTRWVSAGRCRSPRPTLDVSGVRRGVRRPGPSYGARPGLRRRRLVAAVALRRRRCCSGRRW